MSNDQLDRIEQKLDQLIKEFRRLQVIRESSNTAGLSDDELYEQAKAIVMQEGEAKASTLQRKLRIGYARAARLLDILEDTGIIGTADGSKPRKLL